MIIGLDLTWLVIVNDAGGAFHYAVRLTNALVKYSDSQVIAIVNSKSEVIFSNISKMQNFKLVVCDSEIKFDSIIKEEHIDVVHSPRQEFFNVTLSVPMINSLHDLQQFHYPEFFDNDALIYRDNYYRGAAEFSERVIVTYQHVKDDIVKYYSIDSEKIDVCPVGMVEPVAFDSNLFGEIKAKYDLPERYLFYSAASWPHKNHAGLIRAITILQKKHKINIQLVCTGYQYPDSFPQILSIVIDLKMESSIKFLGYVPDSEMPLLLTNATLVVIPTLYEAGSYPLLEAMAYGVPVICSNVTSLPQSIGDSRFIFDPNDSDAIAGKIAEMLNSSKLMEENRTNSIAKARLGGWDSAVKMFLTSYEKAIHGFKQKKSKLYVDKCINVYEARIAVLEQNNRNILTQLSECQVTRTPPSLSIFQKIAKFISK